MLQPRAVHHASTLPDGRVLITGGCTTAGCGGFPAARVSELYDPVTGRFTPGPTMLSPRASNTATVLRDGRILLVGGYPGEGMPAMAAAEVFDPVSERFSAVAAMDTARANHTATLLSDGRVLVAGGSDQNGETLRSTEIFDPRTATFSTGPQLSEPRAAHAAVALSDRIVLVGGSPGRRALATTDVFVNQAWAPGPELRTPRVKHAVAALPGGRILVVGGAPGTEGRTLLASTEVIDLGTGDVTPGPPLSEGEYKLDGALVTLPDHRVVIAGGHRIEVYDPADHAITVLPSPTLPRRSFVTATAVGPGTVLMAGGYDDAIVPTDDAHLVTIPR
ncbi:MAG: hypothetical protein M3Q17_01290 [Actinomycetota bacterium]|nr:hypothetical protein [Actinomycetota bacterium]